MGSPVSFPLHRSGGGQAPAGGTFVGVRILDGQRSFFVNVIASVDHGRGDSACRNPVYDRFVGFVSGPVGACLDGVDSFFPCNVPDGLAREGLAGEAEPGIAFFSHQSVGMAVFRFGKETFPAGGLQGQAPDGLGNGKTVHSGVCEVDAAAVPGLVSAISLAFIQENIIGICRGGAYLFCLDKFGVLVEDNGGAGPPAVSLVEKGRG